MLTVARFWQERPLVEIKDSEELKAWLRGKPREVAVALAARAALRVLPIVQMDKYEGYARNLVLPVFRATAVSWATAKYLENDSEIARARAEAAGAPYSAYAILAGSSAFAALAAADVGADAVADAATAAEAAVRAASAGDASATDIAIFWSAVSDDARRVEEGVAASDIAGSPLWQRQRFHYQFGSQTVVELLKEQPDQLQSLWLELKAALVAANDHWDVWTDWFDDRLAGRVRDEERELAYVSIEEALWAEGPAIVNAEIKRRIELQISHAELDATEDPDIAEIAGIVEPPPIEAIPDQEPIAARFGVNSEGLIDVVPDPPAPGTAADPLQREYFDELRLKAQALVELGPNLLGALNDPANRFRVGLKDRIEDISITSLWSRGNTLRIRLKAHDLTMNGAEPDPGRLPPLVAETLRDLVHTWNIFIVGDPKGRELDDIRLGPQEVQAAKQVVAAAAPVIEALQHSENVATPTAIEAVAEQTEAAKTAPDGIDGDQAIGLARKTAGNIVIEMLRNAYASVRKEAGFALRESRAGFYRQAGASAFKVVAGSVALTGIISFVVSYADVLKAFVITSWHNPTLVDIIDLIVGLWP
jgi:hypothetical protein